MNTRKRLIILILVLVTVASVGLALAGTLLRSAAQPTATVEISCPTPNETAMPICAPPGETTLTPGGLPTAEGPVLLGTQVGP